MHHSEKLKAVIGYDGGIVTLYIETPNGYVFEICSVKIDLDSYDTAAKAKNAAAKEAREMTIKKLEDLVDDIKRGRIVIDLS